VFTHLLLFKPSKKMNGWVFSSDTQMFNLQLSPIKLMETLP
jgi:hypothetical protein